MIDLAFSVQRHILTRTDNTTITTNSKQIHRIIFSFSSEWEGTEKAAVFRQGSMNFNVILDENDSCIIPGEVLISDRAVDIHVSVYGIKDNTTITSTVVVVRAEMGSKTGGEVSNITPTLFEQIMSRLAEIGAGQGISENVKKAVSSYLEEHPVGGVSADEIKTYIADYAEQHRDVLKGEKGDKGNNGSDGKSAYEIAVENGYKGSEIEWIESLKGTAVAVEKEVYVVDWTDNVNTGGIQNLSIVTPLPSSESITLKFSDFQTDQLNQNGREWIYGLRSFNVKGLLGKEAILKVNISNSNYINDGKHYSINQMFISSRNTAWGGENVISIPLRIALDQNGETIINLDDIYNQNKTNIDNMGDSVWFLLGFQEYIKANDGIVTGYPATDITIKIEYTTADSRGKIVADELLGFNKKDYYTKKEIDDEISLILSEAGSCKKVYVPTQVVGNGLGDIKNGWITQEYGLVEQSLSGDVVSFTLDRDKYETNAPNPIYYSMRVNYEYPLDQIASYYEKGNDFILKVKLEVLDANDDFNGIAIPFTYYVNDRSDWGKALSGVENTPIKIGEDNYVTIPSDKIEIVINANNKFVIPVNFEPIFKDSNINEARKVKFSLALLTSSGSKNGSKEIEKGDIVCWGDSLTAGGGWTTKLSTLSGLKVLNGGTGGENAQTIMARQGADAMVVNNITIPATKTPVIIATRATDGGIKTVLGAKVTPLLQGGSHVNPVMIGDIEGTLKWTGTGHADTTGTWTFTRSSDGQEVVINRPTMIRTAFDREHNNKEDIMIIFMGQNGWGDNNIETLINMHRLMIDHFKGKEYLVIGLSSGTAAGRADYEAAMKNAFGRRFISLREYLSTPIYDDNTIVSCYGLEDQGLEPGTKEYNGVTYVAKEEIAQGAVPHQILSDSVHYTNGTKEVIGNLIYQRMKELNIL